MRLYLIRHGETDWNKKMKMQGRADIPLNEYGRELAVKTADALKEVPFDLIYTSPLIRAKETADIIKAGRSIPVLEEERIVEISFGEYEGGSFYQDSAKTIPHPVFTHFFTAPERYEAKKGGESMEAVSKRTKEFLDELQNNDTLQDKTILVSTHGAALCSMLMNMRQRPIEQFWGSGVHKNCAVTIVDAAEKAFQIVQEAVVYY